MWSSEGAEGEDFTITLKGSFGRPFLSVFFSIDDCVFCLFDRVLHVPMYTNWAHNSHLWRSLIGTQKGTERDSN